LCIENHCFTFSVQNDLLWYQYNYIKYSRVRAVGCMSEFDKIS
jgi:hypothetical protein